VAVDALVFEVVFRGDVRWIMWVCGHFCYRWGKWFGSCFKFVFCCFWFFGVYLCCSRRQ